MLPTCATPALTDSLLTTEDGSRTLSRAGAETFHSVHGAVTESRHVFLAASALAHRLRTTPVVRVLEIGFGSGLNFLLAADLAVQSGTQLHYTALENALPSRDHVLALEHDRWLDHRGLARRLSDDVLQRQRGERHTRHLRLGHVVLDLHVRDAATADLGRRWHDVVFHDAFSPTACPTLWTDAFLYRCVHGLRDGGCLVTYCARGAVRRGLTAAGAQVDRLPGPPGKREMLRANAPPSALAVRSVDLA
ncbi:MAG: tRNA (5-methylaminomethyl-2-thiouridine)(34)-methyltransferase MnmD [Pseudomonadota bacterium]